MENVYRLALDGLHDPTRDAPTTSTAHIEIHRRCAKTLAAGGHCCGVCQSRLTLAAGTLADRG